MSDIMKGGESIFINKDSHVGLLMIHGFTSTPHEFKEMSHYFADKEFTVYAPLITGHGTLPENLISTGPADWAESVRQAYLTLKKTCKEVVIIGNSFGSNLGFWLIDQYNNEPAGIVTLDAPIFLRHHILAVLRAYSYGLFKTYYKKSPRIYKADYVDNLDLVTYPVIPMKSIREFFRFIKKETRPMLSRITVPALITHAANDPVIHPKSAKYIYRNITSKDKKIYWFISNHHGFTVEGKRKEVFEIILEFIQKHTTV